MEDKKKKIIRKGTIGNKRSTHRLACGCAKKGPRYPFV